MKGLNYPPTAEVVIIGGGCVGASIAYHLTCLGIRDVVLLDGSALASGPTGRSGAQLIPRSEHPVVAKLKWEGLQFFRNFEEQNGRCIDFRPSGYLAVAKAEEDSVLDADLRQLSAFGSRAVRVRHGNIKDVSPGVRLAEAEVALSIPEAGYVDPTAAVHALTALATSAGMKAFEFSKASIRLKGDAVVGVSTPGGEIDTRSVVVASGVWSNDLLAPIGTTLPLSWHRAEVCFYRRPEACKEHPIVGDFVQRFYFRPEAVGLTMAGSIPKMCSGVSAPQGLESVEHPDRFCEGVRSGTIADLFEKLVSRVPCFSGGYWRRGYACVYDVTPDWHPIVSLESTARGLYVAAGFSGHGFVMSASVGRIVAEAVARIEASRQERHLFRPERFAENEPVSFEIG
jgi:sarcosine oxidase subunit beta